MKETTAPLILPMPGLVATSAPMETISAFTPMPTNQQYNLANISDEAMMTMSEPASMELDMNEAVGFLNIFYHYTSANFFSFFFIVK